MSKLSRIMALPVVFSLALFTACDDDEITDPIVENPLGTLDFTRYIAIGNSLTAGFQSGALLSDGQENSYPQLITDQIIATDGGTYTMKQPLLPYPGIGNEAGVGVLELTFDGTVLRSAQSPATTPTVAPPYHNLGVPGAYSTDVVMAVSGATSWLAFLGPDFENGFFNLVLSGGKTQAELLVEAAPTFVTMWIGNNDVLGYALSGGDVLPQILDFVLTADVTFEAAWNATADSIDATGAKVITATIPNVTDIPHFTTLPFEVPIDSAETIFVSLQYIAANGDTIAATASDLILLPASTLIGVPDSVTQIPFGLSKFNPLPSSLVLDAEEQIKIVVKIAQHNIFIKERAAERGWGVVDFNAIFADIALNGFAQGSITLTTDFISGDLFSLDGIHPTGKGYGIVANEFLKVMDTQFGAEIIKVDISTLPGVAVTSVSKIALNPFTKTPIFGKKAFDGLYKTYGVSKTW